MFWQRLERSVGIWHDLCEIWRRSDSEYAATGVAAHACVHAPSAIMGANCACRDRHSSTARASHLSSTPPCPTPSPQKPRRPRYPSTSKVHPARARSTDATIVDEPAHPRTERAQASDRNIHRQDRLRAQAGHRGEVRCARGPSAAHLLGYAHPFLVRAPMHV